MLIDLEGAHAFWVSIFGGIEHLHPCNWLNPQYCLDAGPHHRTVTGIAMSKRLLILLLPIALAGCAVGHVKLPMSLRPSDIPKASCLTYDDAPAFGNCKGSGKVSIAQRTGSVPQVSVNAVRPWLQQELTFGCSRRVRGCQEDVLRATRQQRGADRSIFGRCVALPELGRARPSAAARRLGASPGQARRGGARISTKPAITWSASGL